MTRRVLNNLGIVFWGVFVFLGAWLTWNAGNLRVSGYPSNGQLGYYLYFPAAMLLLNGGLALSTYQMPKALYVAVSLIQLLVVALFIGGYGGRM